jgi:hypothetical protein
MKTTRRPFHSFVSLVATMSALLTCSSHTALHGGSLDASTAVETGAAGGGVTSTGGVASSAGAGGQAGARTVARDAESLAGAPDAASDASTPPDNLCDLSALWGLLYLRLNTEPSLVIWGCGPPNPVFNTTGEIVFDESGRIIDDTGYFAGPGGASKRDWLNQVSSYQWLCMAGRTQDYWCAAGGD